MTGSRYSRSGPLSRPESSPGQRLRRGPTLEVEKTCSQEKSSSLAAAAAAAGRRGLASTANRQSRQSRPTHTRSEQPAMYVSPADNVRRHRARPGRGHPAPRVVARNATATLPRLRGRSRASGLRPSEITRQRSRRPPTIALHHKISCKYGGPCDFCKIQVEFPKCPRMTFSARSKGKKFSQA